MNEPNSLENPTRLHCGKQPDCQFEFTKNLRIDSPLSHIPGHRDSLDIQTLTCEAIKQFETNPTLPGILLKSQGELLGMLSRRRFYEFMSRPFSLEIFPQRPLGILWNLTTTNTLVLDTHLGIVTASQQALKRNPEDIYEPIVVRVPLNQYRFVDIHTLLLAQNYIHQLALRALEISNIALTAEKELAQITLNSIADGVITTNKLGKIQAVNPIAEKLTKWSRNEAVGCELAEIFQPIDERSGQLLPSPIEAVLKDKLTVHSQEPVILQQPNYREEIEYSASPILDKNRNLLGAILVFRDVGQQRELSRQIQWQASHDTLTGLMNRPEFEIQLEHSITAIQDQKNEYSHILIYLDLDRFKVVNDTCGHLAGDELLRQVGTIMQNSLHPEDLLARLGGDEFGILLQNYHLIAGQQIAERIYRAIQAYRFYWEGYVFTIGVSMGITLIDHNATPTNAIRQADSACYFAKHQGRNQVCFYHELRHDEILDESTNWVAQLTDALNHSKFGLFHQKILSARFSSERQTLYSEILLRLSNSQGEWISPNTFLKTAERYNLMTQLDDWVIQNFCKHYAQISKTSDTGFFAINLSGASLNNPHLSAFVKAQFETQQVSPEQVCFEITETVAIANLSRARLLLQELKAWGCFFALDDFGSGMSSFNYLRSLPVDYLKIDGSLIRDISSDRVAREMVSAIGRIGTEMGLKTIAEWVENEETIKILQDIQIDYVQGFSLHSPEPLIFSRI